VKENDISVTSGLYDEADDGEKNMTSDVLPPNNPLGIWHNRVDIEKEKEEFYSVDAGSSGVLRNGGPCGYAQKTKLGPFKN